MAALCVESEDRIYLIFRLWKIILVQFGISFISMINYYLFSTIKISSLRQRVKAA